MKKTGLFYLATTLLCGAVAIWVFQSGRQIDRKAASRPDPPARRAAPAAAPTLNPAERASSSTASPGESARSPLARLLIQLIVIILAARLFGALAARLGQPVVIGEMIAGLALGPTLVGTLFPGFSGFVFPPASLGDLKLLSQIGVVLFMFVVGMEMDSGQLRCRARTALMVSHAGIALPFVLGLVLSLALYRLAPGAGEFVPFSLFIGIAMSITAFPVLARIIEERRMTRTSLGVTALTCAAINDAAAWTILALVVAVAQAGSLAGFASTILLVTMFAAAMIWGAKPLLARLPAGWTDAGRLSGGAMAAVLVFAFLCALFTEAIGIHALFGAFLAGVAMPEGTAFRERLRERLEGFSAIFLLPVFFVFTGLRTQVGLLTGWGSWGLCLAVIAAATLGKLGGSLFAARWSGMGWADSFSLGALMNTRGLVELIVLNVGYDMGILPPTVFAMMVVMAVATTCLTGPLLALGQSWGAKTALARPASA